MTLDYTKMFLIVTEEAVVRGHFTCLGKNFIGADGTRWQSALYFVFFRPLGGFFVPFYRKM